MTITPEQARELLDNFVMAWEPPEEEMFQAAPDMAETIAGMTWEYQISGSDQWFSTAAEAVEDSDFLDLDSSARLVRRLVSAPEVVDGE